MPASLTICLLVWQEYLTDWRQASLFTASAYLTGRLLSTGRMTFWYSLLARPATMLRCVFPPRLHVSLPTSSPLCPPVCLAVSGPPTGTDT